MKCVSGKKNVMSEARWMEQKFSHNINKLGSFLFLTEAHAR
jgi:hypothetical protein